MKETAQYIKALQDENENLKQQLKFIGEERDQINLLAQRYLAKYLELASEKGDLNKEDILREVKERIEK